LYFLLSSGSLVIAAVALRPCGARVSLCDRVESLTPGECRGTEVGW